MGAASVLLNAEPKVARRAWPASTHGFLRTLSQNRLNLAGALLTIVLIVGAAVGPLFLADPFATTPADRFQAPSLAHWAVGVCRLADLELLRRRQRQPDCACWTSSSPFRPAAGAGHDAVRSFDTPTLVLTVQVLFTGLAASRVGCRSARRSSSRRRALGVRGSA
jgi:hypothetical protein